MRLNDSLTTCFVKLSTYVQLPANVADMYKNNTSPSSSGTSLVR